MSAIAPTSLLDIERRPDAPPIVQAEIAYDAPTWAAENRTMLLDLVARHGSLRVRGLQLRDSDEVAAVFRRLAPNLMVEREAFAARQTYSDRVYSSATWPANQQMCMHHELSYATRFPGSHALRVPRCPVERRCNRRGRRLDRTRGAADRAGAPV